MAKKHQIWSSAKSTRVKANRCWRRQFKETLPSGMSKSAKEDLKRHKRCLGIKSVKPDTVPNSITKAIEAKGKQC